MKFSANQAADETGKSLSTITRAIKNGKLSAQKNDDGSYSIDAAELFRVYPKKDCAIQSMMNDATLQNVVSNPLEMEVLRELAEERKDALEYMRRRLDDAEKRAEKAEERIHRVHEEAKEERERLMLLLNHNPVDDTQIDPNTQEQNPEPVQPPRRRWWHRKKTVDV